MPGSVSGWHRVGIRGSKNIPMDVEMIEGVCISERNPLTPATRTPKHFRLNFELQAPESVSSLQ
jgi:hypothetical protein